ncbi:hypothetical protein FHT70_000254 [Rhizobium sp. BK049]|nr:hypothetical protein [Rhizobium sp. BK049]
MLERMRMNDGNCVCVTDRHHRADDMAAPEPSAKREGLDPAGANQYDALGMCHESCQKQRAVRAEGNAIQFRDRLQIFSFYGP